MLQIQTFDARAGGNVLYKALAHPLASEGFARLYARLAQAGPVAEHAERSLQEAAERIKTAIKHAEHAVESTIAADAKRLQAAAESAEESASRHSGLIVGVGLGALAAVAAAIAATRGSSS